MFLNIPHSLVLLLMCMCVFFSFWVERVAGCKWPSEELVTDSGCVIHDDSK